MKKTTMIILALLAFDATACNALKKKAIADMVDADVTAYGAAPSALPPVQTTTLECTGRQSHAFTNQTFDVAAGPAINAKGHCKITCTDCTIKAPKGINVSGGAQVTLTGGTLEGTTLAIHAGGDATVTLSGTKVTGRVERKGHAVVNGAALADNGEAEKLGKGACDELFDCYKKWSQYGPISGKVTAQVGANGHAQSAAYSGGTASKDVQHCMTEIAKAKTVTGATKAGALVCEYSGSYDQSDQSIDYDETFR